MKKLCAALMLAAVMPGVCPAETACVYEYQGEVSLLEPGASGWRVLDGPAPLKEGSRVMTGAKSSCKLLAGDGTVIELGENSETAAGTLKLDKQERHYGFDLVKGRIMLLIPRLKEKLSKLEFRTPQAVCAIRGTGFSVLISSAASSIGLFEGALDIQSGGRETALLPGSEALAAAGGAVEVSGKFSKLMQAEQRRYLVLKKYAERLRRKLEAREDFIDGYLGEREKKLRERERRAKERLNDHGKK
ncbi:MAG: hypothetical protein A3J79_11630 [Elusimicrobia bacterium RIFOXYB2_FULL_62_6]|nr:MAG: hypothetical protein A3J79_11630 [Elusimicrobia bacterium RIFOXYB2_FULL_62_6]